MRFQKVILFMLLFQFPVCRVLLAQSAAPRLFFTDLESGPQAGGMDNLGVFITLYGEGFGSTRGNSRVTIGGGEVARYVLWGENNAPSRGIDMIVVQPGPGTMTGDIVVTVEGQPSNSLPFSIRPGHIYFVDAEAPLASDANPGTADRPFRTLYRPREVMQPGDTVYVSGTFAELDPAYPGWDTVLLLSLDQSAGGTPGNPIAYIGYPGRSAILRGAGARRGLLLNQDSGPLGYVTVANLGITEVAEPLPVSGSGHRIIGNRIYDAARSDSGAIGVNGDSTHIQVLGNLLRQNGQAGEKLHHGFYPGGYGTTRNLEFAWNEILDQQGGRGIQMYGHLAGDFLDQIWIHDNLIAGSELNNVLIGGSDGGTDAIGNVTFHNNIIAGSLQEPGLRINTAAGSVQVMNNTFHGNAQSEVYLENAGESNITFRNNLLSARSDGDYVWFEAGRAGPDSLLSSHNLYFNAGPAPLWDAATVQADPLFRDPSEYDFRLLDGSPAIDAGTGTPLPWDFAGNARPLGSQFDIGAFEYGSLQPGPFLDVPPGHTFFTHVNAIYAAKVTNGCGPGYFCPESLVTREQMAAFIIRSLEGDHSASYCAGAAPFSDVPADSIQCGNIRRLAELGITRVAGSFDPLGLVTRGQMAAFIIRSLYGESFVYTQAPYFDDVPPDHGFFKYVQRMRDLGLTRATGTYFVDRPLTRGEAAAFIARAFFGLP